MGFTSEHKRERLFFGLTDLTAFTFVGLGCLKLLLSQKKELHGQLIQQQLYEVFGNQWRFSNNILYKVLHTYEDEGYLRSHWTEAYGPNKKVSRHYAITDAGVEYFKAAHPAFSDKLQHIQKLWDKALHLLWNNDQPPEVAMYAIPFSSSLFCRVYTLYLLSEAGNEKEYIYARELQEMAYKCFDGLWQPSDGMLYPMLVQMDADGFVESEWMDNGEIGYSKKRTARGYKLTAKGREELARLRSDESGVKQKILSMSILCKQTIAFIAK